MSTGTSAEQRGPGHPANQASAWSGWVVFAATMMAMLGVFHVIAGLVAIFDDEYYLVTESGLIVNADFTAWGWTHLLIGALLLFAAFSVVKGSTWARVVTVGVAGLSAIVNLAFMAAQPLWSVIMITLAVLCIYAVTAHGDRASMARLTR